MSKQLFISLFFLGGSLLYSQECNYSFRGIVLDLHENRVLSNAVITLLETGEQKLTDTTGKFRFSSLCKKEYTLQVNHVDCKELIIKIAPPFSVEKRLYLEHHFNELEEIILTDLGQKQLTKTGIESHLSNKQINRLRTQSLGEALMTLSGVSGIKTGNAIVKPVVHGVSGTRIAIVNDGIRLQDHEWGADHAPSIDLNGTHQIRLIKGATGLKYGGDAIGGILEIIPQKQHPIDSLFGSITSAYQTQGSGKVFLADVTKSFQTGKFYGANASLKAIADLESPDYVLSNTGNKERHLKLFWGRNTITQEWRLDYSYFNKESGILSAAHLGRKGDLARAIKSGVPLTIKPKTAKIKPPKQTTVHHNLTARYESRKIDHIRWDFKYSYQSNNRKEFDLRRGELKNRAALDVLLQSHDLQLNTRSQQDKTIQWYSGLSAQFQDNFSNPETRVKRLIPDYLRYKAGVYAVGEYIPSNDFLAEIGFRFDYDHIAAQKFYRISDWNDRGYDTSYASTIIGIGSAGNYLTEQLKTYKNFSASTGIKQHLGQDLFLFFNIGYITRSPNPSELFSDGLHHALATIEYGDLRLTQERTLKQLISIEQKKHTHAFVLAGYWSRVSDFIVLEPTEAGIDQARNSAFLVRQYRQLPKVNFFGLDAELSVKILNQLRFEGTIAWVKAEEEKGPALIDIPPLNTTAELIFPLAKKNNIEMRLKSNYVAQQRHFPNYNFSYNFIENNAISTEIVDISTPPSAYHLIGAEINAQVWNGANIRVIADNLLNVNYRNYLNRLRYFSADSGRNIRIELTYRF